MLKHFCDFCGKAISNQYRKLNIEHAEPEKMIYSDNTYIVHNQDICLNCLEKIFPQYKKDALNCKSRDYEITFNIVMNDGTEYPYSLPSVVSEAICENFLKETMGKTANGDLYIKDCVISITEEKVVEKI